MYRDCAILLTHEWSPRLAKHVERLKRETAGVLDVYLVLQAEPGAPPPSGMAPDLTITIEDSRALFPTRTAAFKARTGKPGWVHYVDLVWIPAFLHPKLDGYDRFWLIEYDVDLDGDWGRFFSAAAHYEGDALLTRVRRLSQEPDWTHASGLQLPASITDPLIGLFSISRLTRPLLVGYVEAVASTEWGGHFEALIPTFAEAKGLRVAEIGGEGLWTPPNRTNLHYTGRWDDQSSLRTTFSVKPPHAYRYRAERRFVAGDRDTLVHPVKPDATPYERLKSTELDLRLALKSLTGR